VAAWLEKPQASLVPTETYPSLVIVTEGKMRTDEKAVKDRFLQILAADTPRSLFDRFSGLDVVTLSQLGTMSNGARHRRLKDRLMRVSDRIRKHRTDSRTFFSARHFHAFFRLACQHLTGAQLKSRFVRQGTYYRARAPDAWIRLTPDEHQTTRQGTNFNASQLHNYGTY
jgi:hypothetical protein